MRQLQRSDVGALEAAGSAGAGDFRKLKLFDNPDLLACCVVGDGESETGPLATSRHGNKFLNPTQPSASWSFTPRKTG
ncbi:MAG: hypothetical protein WCF42_13290 [Terriglobales bacterium]|jgi:xylulose-5-phosphate/fructose-6-phosphate phosphoketolase